LKIEVAMYSVLVDSRVDPLCSEI